jgi:hypothetical protein
MRRLQSRQVRWVGGVMALALTLVSFLANSVQADQDKLKVAKMTGKMKTVCVGRFLIDLPAEASVRLRRGFISGYDVASTDRESGQDFDERLAQLEAELHHTKTDDGRAEPKSMKAIVAETGAGKVFVHNRRWVQAFEGERIVDIESVDVQGMLRLPGVSILAQAKGMALDSGDELVRLLGRFRATASDEIPREPGFCIGHAIVRDPYEHDENESVIMLAGLPGHPDVNIVLSSMAGVDPAPRLLERHAVTVEKRPVFMRLAFSHLREAARAINGLDGDELVMRVLEANFTTGYSFQWEMTGRKDDVKAPLLMLELDSGTNSVSGGRPVQSTLSEEAMIDLWDRISGSIRLRPTVPQQASISRRPASELGTVALAGDRCPHNGWWECRDGTEQVSIYGGQRQFIQQGRHMPQALLLPQQTLWQRIRGLQPSYESRHPTSWSLADKRHSARIEYAGELDTAEPMRESRSNTPGTAATARNEDQIGSIVRTGSVCPVNGWWRCEDAQALDGTRWFAAGSSLPAATFVDNVAGWGARASQHVRRRSAWKLLRIVDRPSDAGSTALSSEN